MKRSIRVGRQPHDDVEVGTPKKRYIKVLMTSPKPTVSVVTINRPDVIADIALAAARLTGGNKTEAVALAVRRLLDEEARTGSLFGRHRGSVRVGEGVDLTSPALDVEPDAATGREIDR